MKEKKRKRKRKSGGEGVEGGGGGRGGERGRRKKMGLWKAIGWKRNHIVCSSQVDGLSLGAFRLALPN